LLKEECHLDKVVDPSAGSYYLETLTASVADVAWKLFLETEEKGGFLAAVMAGDVQKAVNASNDARKKAVLLPVVKCCWVLTSSLTLTKVVADKIRR
jgi:methylmalonyl-CoA mutase